MPAKGQIMMLGTKNTLRDFVRVAVALLLCPALAVAQSTCTLVSPPRPAGNQVFYSLPDGHGNSILNFTQQSQGGGNNSSGNHLPTMTPQEIGFWDAGMVKFGDLVSVVGNSGIAVDPLPGLGPRFNGNGCSMCHAQPAIGGSSPGPGTPQFTQNPQIPLATFRGATNTVPSFVTANGPTVEARFPLAISTTGTPLSSLDGSVQQLYTIVGRNDAPAPCTITQPPFATEVANNNVILRIPTPTYGMGFIETTPDAVLQANLLTTASNPFGIKGRFNTTGNDQSITRFGWKAQNSSMLMFAGEASNVEMGVTNELFPFERRPGDCAANTTPEDFTTPTNLTGATNPDVNASDIEVESFFMFTNTAPAQCDFNSGTSGGAPQCLALGSSAQNGRTLFTQIGCNVCHTPKLTTGPSIFPDLNNATYQPFSDFALHHMGATLADGVNQGAAGPDEFRTAPLWGTGQRLFFLHDGRTSDLAKAVKAQCSPANICTTVTSTSETFTLNGQTISVPATTSQFCGSEANAVVNNFNNLTCTQQQDVLNFLRSL
jgi:CxxC motif-containing protein (DUF1111 family)